MPLENTYAQLPGKFHQRIRPERFPAPELIRLNRELADDLGLDLPDDPDALARIFCGEQLLDGSDPIAQAYAGHQFGHFVPQLGDGRAHLLGEVVAPDGRRFDIQLKGSGVTRFSRGGDGRAPLGPVIREYVVSEAMHRLGVPTTRSLAMVATGETVRRDAPLPGGVLARVASSHVRVGTFEFFAARRDFDAVKQLADYVIQRHCPELANAGDPFAALFETVCRTQASLVARWLSLGFIHGVMNTDNTAICGETVDYGPCAFMDAYNPAQVYSSIDRQGRYAFNNQPAIAHWNMACLGGCLAPVMHGGPDNEQAQAILAAFPETFRAAYQKTMTPKLGLPASDTAMELVEALLALMHDSRADFTNAFRALADAQTDPAPFRDHFTAPERIDDWLGAWNAALEETNRQADAARVMRAANPAFIPRNHRIEQAIRAAEDRNDLAPTEALIAVLARPYDDQPGNAHYADPPRPEEIVHQTFCGT